MQSPITAYLNELHADIATLRDGVPYPVRPKRARIDPDDFGIALATVDGYVYTVGTTAKEFSLQSISKPLTYGLAISDAGTAAVDAKVDLEPSGDPFNEISLDPLTGRPANAMINAGALAVVSMIKGSGGRSAIQRIDEMYATFAGRALRRSARVLQAELRHSDRNHALAYLLSSVGIIETDPTAVLENYLRQCAVQVTCRDLAMIAATLANGGTNPVSGSQALPLEAVERVLSVMMTSGMYDDAGDWVSNVGMPAKSGVGGGIVAVLPGQAGLAVYSPPLDPHGNSVRGVAACRRISRDMEMHFVRAARMGRSAIRARYTIDHAPSTIRRGSEAQEVLTTHGHRVMVIELAGDLFFAGTESVVREVSRLAAEIQVVVLDVRRLDEVSDVALRMLQSLGAELSGDQRRLVLVDPDEIVAAAFSTTPVPNLDTRDRAIAWCESWLLVQYGPPPRPGLVPVVDSPVLDLLDAEAATALAARMQRRSYADGEVIRRVGQRFGGIYFILSGQIVTIGTDASGHRLPLTTLTAGMIVGDLALGDQDRQTTTAKAAGPVEVMLLDAEAIDDLEHSTPELALQLWRALARHAHAQSQHYAQAAAGQRDE